MEPRSEQRTAADPAVVRAAFRERLARLRAEWTPQRWEDFRARYGRSA